MKTPFAPIIVAVQLCSLHLAVQSAADALLAAKVLSADHEPVIPGEIVTYTIDYATLVDFIGARQTLSAVIPPGLRFLFATHGGDFINGAVEWDFEAVPALERGQRQFTVEVDPGAKIGSVLTVFVDTQWHFTSHIQAKHPLELSVQGTPRFPNPENTVDYTITAVNSGLETLHKVRVNLSFDVSCSYPYTPSWDLGDIEPGASRSATYQMQSWFCNELSPFLEAITVEGRSAENSFPARSVTALWFNSVEDRTVTLHVTGISPASPSPGAVESPLTIMGGDFSPDCQLIFQSGQQRIEIPSDQVQFVSPNQIRTAVAFPTGSSVWILHMIRYPDAAQFVFNVGSSLRLLQAETLAGARTFRCWLQGGTGRQVSVEWSSDLVQWNNLTNLIPTAELALITDSAVASQAIRYYRAKSGE